MADRSSTEMSDRQYLDLLQAHGMYGIVHYSDEVSTHPFLLGWLLDEEPDQEGVSPEQVKAHLAALRSSETLHPAILSLSEGFFSDGQYSYVPQALNGNREAYRSYMEGCDVAAFTRIR